MANYSDTLAAAQAQLCAEHAAGQWLLDDMERLDRLIHRPCMDKVFRALAALLPPVAEPWRRFLAETLLASYPAEFWRDSIRPSRRRFEQRRAAALRAGRELAEALRALTEGPHGYALPAELKWPPDLLERAAIDKGYTPESAHRLADPLKEDAIHRLANRSEALGGMLDKARLAGAMPAVSPLTDYPEPVTVADLLQTLLAALDGGAPGRHGDLFPGQTQGGNPPQVYVRALAHALERLAAGLDIAPAPARRLLSYDNLARVTRAALDLPDEPPGFPWRQPFDGEDVRRALGVSED